MNRDSPEIGDKIVDFTQICTLLIRRKYEWYHSFFLLIRSPALLASVVNLFRFRILSFSTDCTYFRSIRFFLSRKRHDLTEVEESPTLFI